MTDRPPSPLPSPDHEALAAELGRVITLADPVPAAWRTAAGAAFGWTAIGGVPARLAYDSHLVGDAGDEGARPAGTVPRQVRYTSGMLAVELDLDIGADKLRVLGRVVPAARVELVAHWPGGQRAGVSDEDGAFRFDELPRRALCIAVGGDNPVKTGWVAP
jgi:hypothetical protein